MPGLPENEKKERNKNLKTEGFVSARNFLGEEQERSGKIDTAKQVGTGPRGLIKISMQKTYNKRMAGPQTKLNRAYKGRKKLFFM